MRILAVVVLVTLSLRLSAQQRVGFAYCDVDRLYDTVPSLFYDDSDYTPQGRLEWTRKRYERKVMLAAAVIDSLSLPVVGLYGVENEQVVRDIAARCNGDYSYIHRTLNTLDGLDLALFYFGDVLFPASVENGRHYLKVEASVGGRDFVIILVHRAKNLEDLVGEVRLARPDAFVVVAGDMRDTEYERLGLSDVTERAERAGRGNALYSDGWRFVDRILVDRRLSAEGDVFARRWLTDARGRPEPTYEYRRYVGGYGRRLPVFCYIR